MPIPEYRKKQIMWQLSEGTGLGLTFTVRFVVFLTLMFATVFLFFITPVISLFLIFGMIDYVITEIKPSLEELEKFERKRVL